MQGGRDVALYCNRGVVCCVMERDGETSPLAYLLSRTTTYTKELNLISLALEIRQESHIYQSCSTIAATVAFQMP